MNYTKDQVNVWIDSHVSPEMLLDVQHYNDLSRDMIVDMLVDASTNRSFALNSYLDIKVVHDMEPGNWMQFYFIVQSHSTIISIKRLNRAQFKQMTFLPDD